MFKGKKAKSFNNGMVRTVFDNSAEKTFKKVKNWYGTITTSNDSFLVTHETIGRSEALAIFEEEARLTGGRLDKYIGTFK